MNGSAAIQSQAVLAGSRKERFLIALAKFLGVQPTGKSPLPSLLVKEQWYLDELLNPILVNQPSSASDSIEISLTLSTFNQLMLSCGRPLATKHFFEQYFATARTIDSFEESVDEFRVAAMWLYGNFEFAYKKLATSDESKFRKLIALTKPKDENEFKNRPVFDVIENIRDSELGLLGYVSGGTVTNRHRALQFLRAALDKWDDRLSLFAALDESVRSKIERIFEGDGFVFSDLHNTPKEKISALVEKLGPPAMADWQRKQGAEAIGKRNTERYLTLAHLDVYVATSMRSDDDYIEQRKFINELFSDPLIKDLNLRYFDPTLSYVQDRITKGLIECLMLRRAQVTVYNAGAEDTMGKDSELAATLAQGKTVIVYVPDSAKPTYICKCGQPKVLNLDRRASTFKADHPLGLQISARTGVAHGIIVVRTAQECAEMLRLVMLNQLEFEPPEALKSQGRVAHKDGNFLLYEKKTQSIVRVVSDDPLLTHSFWTYFKHSDAESEI